VILAMSACRTSITEVYQSGGATAGVANGWGCEVAPSQATKYVAEISTGTNGQVTAKVRNVSSSVDTSFVTLIPLSASGTAATYSGTAQALFGWRCGLSGDGTTVNPKFLPGSCRG
jgi:type IV pilus assembly protein PilA